MAQGQYGRDFHPRPPQDSYGRWEQQQQQGLNTGNNQHMESVQLNGFQSSLQQRVIPEGYFHTRALQNMQQNDIPGTMRQSSLRNNFQLNLQQNNIPVNMQCMHFHGNIQQQSNTPGNMNPSNYPGMQNAAGNMFGGAPYTSFQGHFLVPVKAEVEQLPAAQLRDRVMEFVKVGQVNFDTLVFHTGSGELHRLGFYFNQHIMSIVVLNAMFNNSSQGDRAHFNQAPEELRLFNMQEQQKAPGNLGVLNQELFTTAQQVFRQQELDNQMQAWRMEAAHAHLRTLDWVLHQEPYDGSDAQDSVDREEEMIRRRELETEPMEEEMELDCAFNTKEVTDARQSSAHPQVVGAQPQQPTLSPRRTRSGAVLCPNSPKEMSAMEHSMFSPRRTRNGALY